MLQLQQKRPLYKQLHQISKKLVLVLATFASVTGASKENVVILDQVPWIYYPIWLKKSKNQVQTLINFGSKVNAMIPEYILKLGLKVCFIDIEA